MSAFLKLKSEQRIIDLLRNHLIANDGTVDDIDDLRLMAVGLLKHATMVEFGKRLSGEYEVMIRRGSKRAAVDLARIDIDILPDASEELVKALAPVVFTAQINNGEPNAEDRWFGWEIIPKGSIDNVWPPSRLIVMMLNASTWRVLFTEKDISFEIVQEGRDPVSVTRDIRT